MNKLTILLLSIFLVACQVEKKSGGDDYIADHRRATNTFTIKNSQSGTLKANDVLTFTLSFPSAVTVTGTPQLNIEIGSSTRKAVYQSGHETKDLIFTYTIIAGDNDADGIKFKSIDLNGGSLQFILNDVLTNCSTSMKEVHYKTLLIDNTPPTITGISHAQAPGIYYWNDNLTFSVKFSEKVIVTGAPQLDLTFAGPSIKKANYVSGSGTETLTFRYTIEDTVNATGINFPASIALNGGTIKDTTGFDLTNSINATIQANARTSTLPLIVDGRIPKLLEVVLPPNGTYGAAQELDFTLVFDRDVDVVGTPRLEIQVGSITRQVNLHSGAGTDELTFRYTAIPGDDDSDGITLTNNIIFPTETDYIHSTVGTGTQYQFTNIANNNNLKNPVTSGIRIAAIQPKIMNITRTSDTTNSLRTNAIDNVWNIGQELFLLVQFNTPIWVNNDNGSPILNFTIGGVPKTASYLSGGDGQTTLVFKYTVVEGDNSSGANIGVGSINLNNSVIKDARETQADVNITQTSVLNTVIDGVRPIISSVGAPAGGNGTYSQVAPLNELNFPVQFSEPVVLATNGSNLPITIGAATRNAEPVDLLSAEGDNVVNFRYAIAEIIDNDSDGINITSPISNAPNVRDDAGNTAVDLTFTAPTLTGVLVDSIRPTITSVDKPAAATYKQGDVLNFTVHFSEPVTYTGTPRIQLNIGGATANANVTTAALPYTTSLTFSYTIGTNLLDDAITFRNLETATRNAIVDIGRNNIGTVNLPAIGTTIGVDSRAPTMTPSLITPVGYYHTGDKIQIRLTADENVSVTGSPILQSTIGANVRNFVYQPTGSTASQLIFEYTVVGADFDFNGLSDITTLVNPGDIKDDFENSPSGTLASTLDMSGIKIIPTSFLAWSAGQTTNVYTGAATFSGPTSDCSGANCFSLTGTESVGSSVSNVRTVFMRLSITEDSAANDTLLDNFRIEDDGDQNIVLVPISPIPSLSVNGAPVALDMNGKYQLGVGFDTLFNLEIDAPVPISNPEIAGPGFIGEIRHIFLFSAPLDVTQRTAVQTAAN